MLAPAFCFWHNRRMLHRSKWLPLGAAFLSAILLAACRGESERRQPEHKAEPAPAPTKPPLIRDDRMDREAVILAVLRAATAAALGKDDREAQRALKGRKLTVRIRFGCTGIADPDRSWSFDEAKQVLRVKVRSSLTEDALPPSDLLRSSYEGGVGFALGRPWLLTAGCPAAGFGAMAGGEPTIVLAHLFTAADSRVQRPEREYTLTKQLEPEGKPAEGLDLVLSGRLAELADGRPIHCAAQDGPPACIVSTRMDRVAIENPATGELLGEWGAGAASQ